MPLVSCNKKIKLNPGQRKLRGGLCRIKDFCPILVFFGENWYNNSNI